MSYSYARFSGLDLGVVRIGGRGLGNLLFTWAEFVVGTVRHGLIPLAPTWPQFKFGPVARNESDKRFYRDLFSRAPGEVSGFKKLRLLSTLPRIPASQFANGEHSRAFMKNRQFVVEFENAGTLFEKILYDHELVRTELLAITRERHKKGLRSDFRHSISVHVRLGDFRVESLQTPIEWFAGAIRVVRETLGCDLPVHIFSDGSDEELRPLLGIPGTARLGFGSSISDILALSSANILIATGGSTFSKWAAYLGRVPVIYPPRTLHQKLYYDRPVAEVEWREGEPLGPDFVEQLVSRI